MRTAPARARPLSRRGCPQVRPADPCPTRPWTPAGPVPGGTIRAPRARRRSRFSRVAGVLVHAVVHRRRQHERRGACERRAREQVVGDACGELRDRVRGCRRDAEHVAAADQLEVRDRRVIGRGSPGNAPRAGSASNSSTSTGAPVTASNVAFPTNRRLAGVWTTRTAWPAPVRGAPARPPCRRRCRRTRRRGSWPFRSVCPQAALRRGAAAQRPPERPSGSGTSSCRQRALRERS